MKNLFIATTMFLSVQFVSAQSADFKKDIQEFLSVSGNTKTTMIAMKEQFKNYVQGDDLDKMMKEIEAELPKMSDKFVEIYAQNFTHEEIKQLIQFYKSPLGKTMIEKTEKIMPLTIKIGQEWGANLQPILMKYMQ